MQPNAMATLEFKDAETGESDLAIIRVYEESLVLCLSKETNGDVEIELSPTDCERLVAALKEGLESIKAMK